MSGGDDKNEGIFDEMREALDMRARAIGNWKRLKIVIAILRLANGKMAPGQDEKPEVFNEEESNLDEKLAKYIILPNARLNVIWNMCFNIIYIYSVLSDTFMLATNLTVL